MKAARNIINLATSFKGTTFKRTTATNRFKFAVITTYPEGNNWANFYETITEANAHRAAYYANFERNQANIASYETKHTADQIVVEVVTVDHSFKA